jgi:peroxiredoxin
MVTDMKLNSNTFSFKLLAVFAVLAFVGVGCAEPAGIGVDIGQEAPDFATIAFDGQEVSLSDYRGEKVLLDFWAMWCPFCANEIPEIQSLHEEYPDLTVIGVHRSATESYEEAQGFSQDLGVTYQMFRDDDDNIYDTFSGGRPLMPLAVLIDENGIVQKRLIGPKTADQIKELFK